MASSSKPVLGAAAMMLIEEGLLHPRDEVATYLPQFGEMQVAVLKEPADRDISPLFVTKKQVPEHRLVPAERAITIHHLLTHTSGLDSNGLGSAVAALPEPGTGGDLGEPRTVVRRHAAGLSAGHRGGATARGWATDVVARIIKIVSGLPYDEFVRTRIFEPLGMTDTHFNLPPEKESRRVQRRHAVREAPPQRAVGRDHVQQPSRRTLADERQTAGLGVRLRCGSGSGPGRREEWPRPGGVRLGWGIRHHDLDRPGAGDHGRADGAAGQRTCGPRLRARHPAAIVDWGPRRRRARRRVRSP